jgi:hypothetical protein
MTMTFGRSALADDSVHKSQNADIWTSPILECVDIEVLHPCFGNGRPGNRRGIREKHDLASDEQSSPQTSSEKAAWALIDSN